jgi:hypothetical protein
MLLMVPLMIVQCYAQALGDTPDGHEDCDSSNMASTYVPIESWVYPAIERLALAGYVQTEFAGLRPWTRMEVARLIGEAQDGQADLDSQEGVDEQMNSLVKALAREFADELRQRAGECNRQATIDSIYSRSSVIAGPPITDGYHFAQTLVNDYGRPYGQGENLYSTLRSAKNRAGAHGSCVGRCRHRRRRLYTACCPGAGVRLYSRTAARRLCFLRVSRQSDQPWKASAVVGPFQRRTAAIQRQCRADNDAPL